MKVVLRWRDGWWMAFLEGARVEFAMSRSFEHLVCDLVDGRYRIVAVERRAYSTPYGDRGT